MKIQIQNALFYPARGGIENYMYYVSKSLIKSGHKPTILCSKHIEDLSYNDKYEDIDIIRHNPYDLNKFLSPINPFYYQKNLERFIKHNSKDFDAIMSRFPYHAYSSCKLSENIPVLYIQATVWPRFMEFATKDFKGLAKIASKLRYLQDYYIEKKAIELCQEVIVLSEIRMKEISDFYSIPEDKFTVVPPGIDLDRFRPIKKDKTILNSLNIPENSKVILTVCRLSPEKNVEMLIKAFSKMDCENCYLVIVGDGPERPSLENLCKNLNIKRVRFTGFRNDVQRFYSIADVFVLPSIYEGFGQVFLEAMSSGIPCIGLKSNYPDIIVASDEIIINGKNGYLADPYSIHDLADKISNIILNSDINEVMKHNARKMCEKSYSWDTHTQNLLKMIKKNK